MRILGLEKKRIEEELQRLELDLLIHKEYSSSKGSRARRLNECIINGIEEKIMKYRELLIFPE